MGSTIVDPMKYGIPQSESNTLENGIKTAVEEGISHSSEPEKFFSNVSIRKKYSTSCKPID